MSDAKCRHGCGQYVIWDEQHLIATPDGDAWLCSEPRPSTLLGTDKRSDMQDQTRQAIEADKLVTGRGFARLGKDGVLEHIPAGELLIFDGEVDPRLLARGVSDLWQMFNSHTNNVGPGPTAPPCSPVRGELRPLDLLTEMAKILDLPKNVLITVDDVLGAARSLMAVPHAVWLTCPRCNLQHVDEGEFKTKPHHTHACQGCGLTWRPMVGSSVGVQFLPGFKNSAPDPM